MEFALCLPLLLVVIAGIVDFGFVFQRYEVITNAAREGARFASLPQFTGNTTAIQNRVRDYVQNGLSLDNTALNAVVPTGNVVVTEETIMVTGPGGGSYPVNTSTVTVTYNHSFLLLRPILGLINKSWGTTIALRARSQMRNENQIPSGT